MDTRENVRRYWAFISYSHADKQWADWLHRSLERYPVPRDLVGKPTKVDAPIPKRFAPVFRDREELPTASDLGAVILRALTHARFLVVICSPRSARSQWVDQEIVQFKQMHGEDRVLCLIVEGEPWASDGKPGFDPDQECFPRAVRHRLGKDGQLSDERTEPIAADAREHGDGKENAVIKLMAGLLGVGFDDLRRREQEFQRQKARRFKALAGVFALLFVSAVVAATYAVLQKQEVQRTLSNADLQLAVVAREKFDESRSMAYLARSLRSNPENRAATLAAYSSLAHTKQHPPVGPVLRHPARIDDAFGTPDGKHLITVSDGRLFLWSRPDHRLEAEHGLEGTTFTAATHSPDGDGLLAGTATGEIHFLTLDGFKPFAEPVTAGTGAIAILKWDPTGGVLAAALRAEKESTELVILSLAGEEFFRGLTDKTVPLHLSWSTDSAQVAIGGSSPYFCVLTATPEGPILKSYKSELSPPPLFVSGLAFTAERTLRSIDLNAGLQEWNTETGEQIGISKKLSPMAARAAFSPDRKRFLALNRSPSAFVFDTDRAAVTTNPIAPAFTVSDGLFLDAEHVLIMSETGEAQVRRLLDDSPPVALGRNRNAYADLAALSPDRRILANAHSQDPLVRFFDTETLREIARPVRFPVNLQALAFVNGGETLAGLGWDGKVHHTNWRRALQFQTSPGDPLLEPAKDTFTQLYGARPSPDGTRLAVPHPDGVQILNLETPSLSHTLPLPVKATALDWSEDGMTILAASEALELHVLSADGDALPERPVLKLNAPTVDLDWAPDESRIAALTSANQVEFYNALTGAPAGTPIGLEDGCESLRWSPSGEWLFISDLDDRTTVWDPNSGLMVAVLPRLGGSYSHIFSLPGRSEILVNSTLCIALVPWPDLKLPPAWLPSLLETTGGMKLAGGKDAAIMDPDAWMVPATATASSRSLDPWFQLRSWLLDSSDTRTAGPGTSVPDSQIAVILDSINQGSEVAKLRSRFAELWNTNEPAKQAEAVEILKQAAALDPNSTVHYQYLAKVGQATDDQAMVRDAWLELAKAGDASLLEILDAKTNAARACLKLPEPDPATGQRLVYEVLAEHPDHPGAKELVKTLWNR